MKNTDLTALSVTDLQERIRDEKANLHKMRFNHAVSAVENPMRIRQSRREVARMMTELNARQRSNNNA
ncbi:MAG: 50S ribosomal protein L29 [Cytophagia bacterium]|nr:50S ribosomal protein L29 [Cytophagia bacterium]